MYWCSSQATTSITSLVRNGPTLVSTSIVVPTPRDSSEVITTCSASFIQREWDSRSARAAQIRSGGCGIWREILIWLMRVHSSRLTLVSPKVSDHLIVNHQCAE